MVVACEMRFGAMRKGSDALTNRVEQLLASLTVLPLDEASFTEFKNHLANHPNHENA